MFNSHETSYMTLSHTTTHSTKGLSNYTFIVLTWVGTCVAPRPSQGSRTGKQPEPSPQTGQRSESYSCRKQRINYRTHIYFWTIKWLNSWFPVGRTWECGLARWTKKDACRTEWNLAVALGNEAMPRSQTNLILTPGFVSDDVIQSRTTMWKYSWRSANFIATDCFSLISVHTMWMNVQRLYVILGVPKDS